MMVAMITQEGLVELLRRAQAEHRAARFGGAVYPSPELEHQLAELGRAQEAGALPADIEARLARGASFLSALNANMPADE